MSFTNFKLFVILSHTHCTNS